MRLAVGRTDDFGMETDDGECLFFYVFPQQPDRIHIGFQQDLFHTHSCLSMAMSEMH